MLYSKELHGGSKKFQPDTVYVLDPTMPRLKARCPNCDYEEAVYFLIPDEGERKIVTKLICARQAEDTKMVICGEVWDLPDGDKIDKYHVIAQPNNGLF